MLNIPTPDLIDVGTAASSFLPAPIGIVSDVLNSSRRNRNMPATMASALGAAAPLAISGPAGWALLAGLKGLGYLFDSPADTFNRAPPGMTRSKYMNDPFFGGNPYSFGKRTPAETRHIAGLPFGKYAATPANTPQVQVAEYVSDPADPAQGPTGQATGMDDPYHYSEESAVPFSMSDLDEMDGGAPGNSSSSDTSGDPTGGSPFYHGGPVYPVDMTGPDPRGPDEGYIPIQAGEFVLPRSAVDKIGQPRLRMLQALGR